MQKIFKHRGGYSVAEVLGEASDWRDRGIACVSQWLVGWESSVKATLRGLNSSPHYRNTVHQILRHYFLSPVRPVVK